MITIAIIDDHRVVRLGLRYVLQLDPDLSLIAEADSGKSALELFRKQTPNVALLDIRMPEMDGIETCAAIHDLYPEMKVIMLTTSDKEEDIYQSIQHGAKGYLLKDSDPEVILDAIKKVSKGETYFPKYILKQFEIRKASPSLTPRELEILNLVSRGLTNSDISRILDISIESTKTHLKHIFSKLDVQDRSEATALALQRGIINTP